MTETYWIANVSITFRYNFFGTLLQTFSQGDILDKYEKFVNLIFSTQTAQKTNLLPTGSKKVYTK